MTLREEAYSLIDRMPEESVRALIPVMVKLIPLKQNTTAAQSPAISSKMQAFLDMQQMRKASVQYDFSDVQREAAVFEKYGQLDGSQTE